MYSVTYNDAKAAGVVQIAAAISAYLASAIICG
jgi:hypothetical protein